MEITSCFRRQPGMTSVVLLAPLLVLSGFLSGKDSAFAMEGLNSFQEWVKPEKGVFRVAGSDMTDPRFHHSVVLLLAHGEDGTLGLIINRVLRFPFPRFFRTWRVRA